MINSKCKFTGSFDKIPEYTLGSTKQIKAEVETTREGVVTSENIKSPSWQIGQKNLQLISAYNLSVTSGQVHTLSNEELEKNPLVFKCWKSFSQQELVKCSGECGHGQVSVEGTMKISSLRAVFKELELQAPLLGGLILGRQQFWHFTLRLQGQVELESSDSVNGTVGILNLIQASRKSKQQTLFESKGNFVLHTYQKDEQNPVADLKQVSNGLIKGENNSKNYQLDFPLNQILEEKHQSYHFDEIIRNYFFFKGNQEGDIWHPIGVANSSSNLPSYVEWRYKVQVSHNDNRWQFSEYEQTGPELVEVTELPQWDRNIWS